MSKSTARRLRCILLAGSLVPAPLLAQQPAPVDAQAADGTSVEGDGTIVVTGRAQKLYRVEETTSGKMPTEPLASSQTITVITEDLIEDQGARDAQDLYRNISGVSFFSYAGITARGFRQEENFYDGLRGDPYIGFSVPQLFNIERVEFLKGPAGMLYGQTSPGGLFNYVTKRPSLDEFSGSAKVVAGTENRYGGQVEVEGPVADRIALRGGAFFEDRDLPRTWAGNKSLLLDGSALFDLGPAKLTVQALRIEQDLAANRLRGIPVDDEGEFLADREWNHNEPTDFLDLRSTSFFAKLEVSPVEGLDIDLAARRIDSNETQQYHEPFLLDSDGDGTFDGITRQFRDQYREAGIWSTGGNAVWTSEISPSISNRVLAGFDYSTEDALSLSASLSGTGIATPGLPCPLSFANPVYGACDSDTYAMPPQSRSLGETERYGFYLLNELTVGPVIAIAGIRSDTFDDRSTANNGTVTGFEGGDETYRLGLVWRARDDVSFYGQFATSFEPQSASAQDPRRGGPFAPTTGNMFEGGMKTALFDGRLQSTVALYRIKRVNLLQSTGEDPEGDGFDNSVAFGEVTSKGIDVDVAADLTPDWVLTLNYGYNDTRITEDNGNTTITNSLPDGRFVNAPEHMLGFWTRYQIPAAGLAFAFGGDYVSKRFNFQGQPVNPYFVFDSSVSWERGPLQVRLRVDNLFDKTYAASGFSDRAGHFPGRPRSAFVEAGYRF